MSKRIFSVSGFCFFLFCIFFCLCAANAQEIVKEWTFDKDGGRENWTGANHIKNVTVKNGVLSGESNGSDPFFTASGFEFATSQQQAVEIKYRTNYEGNGELYYSNTTQGPYGGFSPKKSVNWTVNGDGKPHTVRIFPGWNNEKKIILLRIDFPNISSSENVFYEIDSVKVLDMNFSKAPVVVPDWDFTSQKDNWDTLDGRKIQRNANGLLFSGAVESKPFTFDIDETGTWVSVQMLVKNESAKNASTGKLTFISNSGKEGTLAFPLIADGKEHWYNVDALESSDWTGKIHLLQLAVSGNESAAVKRLIVSDKPQGPALLNIEKIYQPEGINRAGKASKLSFLVKNSGGQKSEGQRIKNIKVPSGVKVVSTGDWQTLPSIEPLETATYSIELTSSKALTGKAEILFDGNAVPEGNYTAELRFDEALNLPKADYVPVPKPVKSDYTIGSLYYPGWGKMEAWARIYNSYPERKPVLGWYDESNPEVIDWQIKWSVENGIQYYLVDWYWNKGYQHNDHWIKGFYKAKYRSMFKWAMMWANHNGAGSHSEEDQRAVTKFWIDNYFKTPEYLTRDGKPVVMIWSAGGMDSDIIAIEAKKGKTLKKGEGVKKLLDLSQQTAKDAGLKGIYFIAMKWPEASTKADDIQWLADAGFEETSIYHFMHHGGKAKNPARFTFDLVVDASVPYWESRLNTGILPFLPNLSTGWDARPWHGEKTTVVSDRTVAKFRQICSDYKKFADKHGIKEMVTAPTNEWGEGSYGEPNAEFGFGMFEAIRDTFCKKPAEGWSPNYGPQDVGLGSYDYPPIDDSSRTEWNFKDGKTYWTSLMGIHNYRNDNGVLAFDTVSGDPAITTQLQKVKADEWSKLTVRLKISPATSAQDVCQLFWSTSTSPVSETNSLKIPVKIDGQFHDYSFDLKNSKHWRRNITGFRLDPLNSSSKKVEIEFIRLEK